MCHIGHICLIRSFLIATIAYDFGLEFANRYIGTKSRTHDQIVQALRSGKQNIVEGTMASGTSKKTEVKLLGVARASLEEALADAEDYLRQHQLTLWPKTDPRILIIRNLGYKSDKSYHTYMSYLSDPESAANCLICLVHQANFLLDRQIQAVEKEFLEKGGLSERLYQARKNFVS
ncbi:MAG: four helix bundle suffix domain-containing protein [Patescibacteria group bacterium]